MRHSGNILLQNQYPTPSKVSCSTRVHLAWPKLSLVSSMSLVRANAPLQTLNFQHCQLEDLARHNSALKKEVLASQQEIAAKKKYALQLTKLPK